MDILLWFWNWPGALPGLFRFQKLFKFILPPQLPDTPVEFRLVFRAGIRVDHFAQPVSRHFADVPFCELVMSQ
jgi:hypothetical protein